LPACWWLRSVVVANRQHSTALIAARDLARCEATTLIRQPRRQDFFHAMRAHIYGRLQEHQNAHADYAKAIALDPENKAAYEQLRRRFEQ
jgi:Tfp pilus assembly protein PilF